MNNISLEEEPISRSNSSRHGLFTSSEASGLFGGIDARGLSAPAEHLHLGAAYLLRYVHTSELCLPGCLLRHHTPARALMRIGGLSERVRLKTWRV